MPSVAERFRAHQFDKADANRLAILDEVERIGASPEVPVEEVRALADRAFALAGKKILYGMDREIMVDKVAALAAPVDPSVEERAQQAIEKIYADRPELRRSSDESIRPAIKVAQHVLDHVVQTSIDLTNGDEDAHTVPNVPVEAIVQTAIVEDHKEQEADTQPFSHLDVEEADRHVRAYLDELREERDMERKERVAHATDEELSEKDDAVKVNPADLFDDDDEWPQRHVA